MTGEKTDRHEAQGKHPQEVENEHLQYLFELYYDIGERICEKMGHKWNSVDAKHPGPQNIVFQRCQRCKATRADPSYDSSGGSITIDRSEGRNDR